MSKFVIFLFIYSPSVCLSVSLSLSHTHTLKGKGQRLCGDWPQSTEQKFFTFIVKLNESYSKILNSESNTQCSLDGRNKYKRIEIRTYITSRSCQMRNLEGYLQMKQLKYRTLRYQVRPYRQVLVQLFNAQNSNKIHFPDFSKSVTKPTLCTILEFVLMSTKFYSI